MHRTWAAVAALVFASVLAGCGGSGPTAIEVVLNASTKTQAANTARVNVSYSIEGETITAEGVADFARKQETATSKIPGLGSIDEIIEGTTVYLKLPDRLAKVNGTPWMKFDLATGLQALTGVNSGYYSESASNDPAAALDYLRGASDDMHKIGSDTTRGAATTHYRGTMDLDLAASKALTKVRRLGILQLEKVIGVNHFVTDIWIDGAGRMRKLQYRLDASKFNSPAAPGLKLTGFANYTFEMYDFGVAFSPPVLPTPSQVTDVTKRLAHPAPLAVTPPSTGRALADAIIPPPDGFTVSSAPAEPIGPISTAQFDKMMSLKNGAQQLGFVTGYDDTFDNTTGADHIEVTLLKFVSPRAAASFDQVVATALLSRGAVVKYPLPAAASFTSKPDASGSYEHTVLARKGDRVMIIDSFTGTRTPNAMVATVAAEQYPRL